MSGGYMK